MSDLVVHESEHAHLAPVNTSILTMEPEDMVKFATRVANALKRIIESQNLSVDLSHGKSPPYVKVEGWITMGSLLGILPREDYAKELEDGSFEAGVSLVRSVDGRVVSGASSMCGVDEKDRYGNSTWGNRPKFARRSMAITRATGKVYRVTFGWVMSLAGYNPTPLEEMPEDHKTIEATEITDSKSATQSSVSLAEYVVPYGNPRVKGKRLGQLSARDIKDSISYWKERGEKEVLGPKLLDFINTLETYIASLQPADARQPQQDGPPPGMFEDVPF